MDFGIAFLGIFFYTVVMSNKKNNVKSTKRTIIRFIKILLLFFMISSWIHACLEPSPPPPVKLTMQALTYINNGEYNKALNNLLEAEKIFYKYHSKKSKGLATIYINLGIVNSYKGQFLKAKEYMIKSELEVTRLFGPDNPKVYQRKVMVAEVQVHLGELKEAEEKLTEALDYFADQPGDPARFTAPIQALLGLIYTRWGEYEKAGNLLDKSLAAYQKSKKYNVQYWEKTFFYFAFLHYKKGNLEHSLEIMQRLMSTGTRLVNNYPPYYGDIFLLTGKIIKELNKKTGKKLSKEKVKELDEIYSRAMRVFGHCYGDDHPKTQESLRHLVDIHKQAD